MKKMGIAIFLTKEKHLNNEKEFQSNRIKLLKQCLEQKLVSVASRTGTIKNNDIQDSSKFCRINKVY